MTKEERAIYMKKYNMSNKEAIKKNSQKYYKNNKEKVKKNSKKKYKDDKEYFLNYLKKYRAEHKEETKSDSKKYYEKNRKKIIEKTRVYQKKRKNSDPIYKLKANIRTMISNITKGRNFTKKSKTVDIIGCSFEYFELYIESKFEPWMNWSNYGLYNSTPNYGWDIDHIIPMSSAISEEDVKKLNNYTNLQPLCSYVNRYVKRDNL